MSRFFVSDARTCNPPGFALALLLVLCGCQSLHLPEATVQDADDWLTEGGTPERTYVRPHELHPPLELAWQYNAAAGFGPGTPLLVNGAVIVGTRKGEVHAVDLATGKGRGVVGVGDAVDGTPVIDRFGILYVPVAWGRRGLHAYDLTRGTTVWRDKRVPVAAGLLLMQDRLIVADVESRVAVYDARGGEVLWEHVLSDSAIVHAAPVRIAPGRFVVADDEGFLTAMDALDGSILWERDVALPVYNTPAVADGVIYVPTTRGRLSAIDASSGEELWQFEAGNDVVRLTSPAVTDDALFVGGSNGAVWALDRRSGAVRWKHQGREALGGPPLVSGSHVFVTDMGEVLYALHTLSGERVWETELAGRVKSAMAAGPHGLVVLAEPRHVLYFRPTEPHAAALH